MGADRRSVDPDEITTREQMAAALDVLRVLAGFESKRAVTTAAGPAGSAEELPKSTVDDMLNGKRIPTDETLRRYLAVCGVADAAAVTRWLRAVGRVRDGDGDRPPNAIRVSAAQPRHLGVHKTIQVEGATGDLPAYIERDIDAGLTGVRARLAAAADHGGFVLLVGGSSVGKTRCAYEAIRVLLPDWWLVHPENPAEVRDLAAEPPRRTVVWLDELQDHLDLEEGLTAGTVRALLKATAPVVLIGTLWPDSYTRWTATPKPGGPDPCRRKREALALAEVIWVPDRLGDSPTEKARVEAAARTDPRIREASATSDYGLAQTLAAAPQLVERWDHADPYAKAVLTAAVDASRLGARSPLSAAYLRAAAPGYCDEREKQRAPDNWFETALAYATETLHGAAAALEPIGPGMGMTSQVSPVGYTVADFLLQRAHRLRRTEPTPATAWDALATLLGDPQDLTRLGQSAQNRLLYHHARLLYRRSADHGDAYAAELLAQLLAKQKDVTNLQARVADGDAYAAELLAQLLAKQGDMAQLQARAADGDAYAAGGLVDLLVDQGDVAEAIETLRSWAEASGEPTNERLVDQLAQHGDVVAAIEILRVRADAGSEYAAEQLADRLFEQGNVLQLQDRVDAGDGFAGIRLAALLFERGDLAPRQDGVDAGDELDAAQPASRLAEQDDMAELRDLADAGDLLSVYLLAIRLTEQGDVAGAIDILRPQADVDEDHADYAAGHLAGLLVEQGDVTQLRARTIAGDRFSADALATALEKAGQVEEADLLRRFGLAPDGVTRRGLPPG